MRHVRTLTSLAVLAALALTLAACAGSTSKPTSDESDVPAGMPVMYEFFTET